MCEKVERSLPELKSVNLVAKLPVVEATYSYASYAYVKVKNLNRLFIWGLDSVEDTLLLLVDKALSELPLAKNSLKIADNFLYKSLEQIEQRIPAITYPPELLVNMTKDYLSVSVVRPVVKRADSVKKMGLTEASRYGEMAASRLDTALDAADRYLDKYLPESAADRKNRTNTEPKEDSSKSKTAHAIHHVNRLSRKLQRRLTSRTIAEAKALRQQSINTIHTLLYLADLMVHDPKTFADKMREMWVNLSQDEPENQVPPANLEQLVAMLVRESARRLVHLTNFTLDCAGRLPSLTLQVSHIAIDCAANLCDYLIKVTHLDGAKFYVVTTIQTQVKQVNISAMELQKLVLQTLDFLMSQQNSCKKDPIPVQSTPSINEMANSPDKETESKPQPEQPTSTEFQNSGDHGSPTTESISNGETPKVE